ncbi:alanine racemase [Streptomyces erythrochromogenes]|uniref:alanine racemase n=1 Tax=Streptomyces erythrochromogenes TaxID=285574 RepID=UPI00341EA2A8
MVRGLPATAIAGDPRGGVAAPECGLPAAGASVRGGLSEAVVDLEAVAHNTRVLCARAPGSLMMAVVKADGFGHGAVQVARTALAHGADWLGVSSPAEALALREAGITAPVLAWMHVPDEDLTAVLRQEIDLSVASLAHLRAVAACADTAGSAAGVHLKVDTGLHRNGACPADWPRLVEAAAELERHGLVRVRGLWSHLIHPDDPAHPDTAAQVRAFETAADQARAAGLRPELLHLANSAAALAAPETHYDMVRAGLALYGIEPVRGKAFGLRPAMELRGRIIMSRRVGAGEGVGYGHDHTTAEPTGLALVPLGYADGLPRVASRKAGIQVGGVRRPVVGRIAMDQCVVDTGTEQPAMGEEAVVFGPGTGGEPTAVEWAGWAGTTAHEILTGVGARVPRRYLPARPAAADGVDPRLRVAVLFGGPVGEHEVSCASAAGIVSHLDRARYAVQPIRITAGGSWIPGPEDLPTGSYLPHELADLTPPDAVSTWDGIQQVMPVLAAADVVLPALHGPFGEDGTVQALLETVGVPYVGNGVAASAIGMDKDATKRILSGGGLPVADWALLRTKDSALPASERERLGLPVFVKPARAGSSIGVTRVEDWDGLGAALAEAHAWDGKVLVEEAVHGREVDVAVLEHPDGRLEAGPPLEIEVCGGQPFFDYRAKYEDEATRFTIPARLDPAIAAELRRLAVEVFETLGCSGLIRVDFFLRDGIDPVVNEVNTFPGFTAASQYPQIWAAAGLPYPRLLDTLIETALTGADGGRTPQTARSTTSR